VRIALWITTVALFSLLNFVSCSSSGGGSSPSEPAPEITSLSPAANNPSVVLGSPIAATFDQTMNSASSDTFVVFGSQSGKLGGIYSGGGSDTLQFVSNTSFKPGELVEVILTDSLTSTEGVSLEPFVYCFRAETIGGSGTFAVSQTVSGQNGPSALAVGDWDGDGAIDLASANRSNNSIAILINDGTGNFTADPNKAVTGQTNTDGLAAGDWDGDGDLDLASANYGNNTITILINDGTGSFTVTQLVTGQINTSGLAAGDWDGDGDLDLASANYGSSSVTVLTNDGTGNFTVTQTVTGQINTDGLAAGDWDGDGDLDLASANNGGNRVTILINNGVGKFSVGQTLLGQTNTRGLVAGDWDGDGDPDLASANDGASSVTVLTNDGTGNFTVTETITAQTNTRGLVAGDWNHDGALDLASANYGAANVKILINDNDGTGNFTETQTVPSQINSTALAAGDFFGDGSLGLASANFGAASIAILQNQP
jgi:hypothetical protein